MVGCFQKALNFLKQSVQLAMGLNNLEQLREALYLIAHIYNSLESLRADEGLNIQGNFEAKRDQVASLFLHTD